MALASPLPITWVTADAAYGQEWRFRRILEETAVGYVLAVPRSQQVPRAAPVTPGLALPLPRSVTTGPFGLRALGVSQLLQGEQRGSGEFWRVVSRV
ncbi:transposase [Streptomyces sp. SAI-127]|uniref:transposase n=1 Tax=Streptomyces sp. SAI-127 TaxID=2940543 RepID=UPI002475478B|nr:transposase [Streptomyces sp. SAI-127]